MSALYHRYREIAESLDRVNGAGFVRTDAIGTSFCLILLCALMLSAAIMVGE